MGVCYKPPAQQPGPQQRHRHQSEVGGKEAAFHSPVDIVHLDRRVCLYRQGILRLRAEDLHLGGVRH